MRLSNPGALTAHIVAGDVTGDVRAPLAFAAQPHGADHFLNFTTICDEPDRRCRAKLGAAVISDTGSWARQQPLNRERRQLPACGTAVHDLNAAQLALSVRADTITLVARAAGPRRDPELMQEETPPTRCRRGLDDRHACVPTCGLLHLRVQDPVSPQCVGTQAAPVTSSMNKGSPSGPM